MGTKTYDSTARDLRSLFETGRLGGLTDGTLIDRYAGNRRDLAEPAFHALVDRHGPMVFRVCEQALGNRADAQDAFQATFLIQATKARAIRDHAALAAWLHGVALRVLSDVRASAAR